MNNDTNVTWHDHQVTRSKREALNGHKSCVVWFTGLSASGKSTISNVLDHKLFEMGMHSTVLDGGNVRHSMKAIGRVQGAIWLMFQQKNLEASGAAKKAGLCGSVLPLRPMMPRLP